MTKKGEESEEVSEDVPNEENTVKLSKPIALKNGTKIVSIFFPDPTVSQLRVRDKWEGEMAKEIAVVGRIGRGLDASGDEHTLGFAFVEEMSLSDFTRCQKILAGFLGELQSIGSDD